MNNDRIAILQQQVQQLHRAVQVLKHTFPEKHDGFTLDGRLVGDIGEVIAAELFQIELHKGVTKFYDAKATYDATVNVQIKATFKKSLTYNHAPDYFIGIQLCKNGNFKVVYNGPGKYIAETYQHRKGIGTQLLSFPIQQLKNISTNIKEEERIRMKPGAHALLTE